MILRCFDGEYLLDPSKIYCLQWPMRHEGVKYHFGRVLEDHGDFTRIPVELFVEDHEPPRWSPEWYRPVHTYADSFMLSRLLVLERYDPLRDSSTFEGAFVMLAETLHESRKRREQADVEAFRREREGNWTTLEEGG